jgi:polysaccharide deacetylase 2 family uncharacterized protein YibQ
MGGPRQPASKAMRALGWFWVVTLVLLAGGAGTLQWLGPLHPVQTAKAARPPVAAPAPAVAPTAGLQPEPVEAAADPAAPQMIRAPDPALLEPSANYQGGMLPRIAADGRMPMRYYAAHADPPDARPRVALLLSGIGMSETDSVDAIHNLPPAVSLAISPYSFRPERLLAEARLGGHETLVSLPLEPDRFPIDDPGNRALLTGNPSALNDQRLEWALTRFAGYVGATGALNGMRGERFGGAPELMAPLLRELASRGLLYIDPRPGAPPPPLSAGRGVDVVVDEPAVRTEIDANLAKLEQLARDHGSALGLVGRPRPVTLERIADWASTLASRGLVLVPVSALAHPAPPRVPRQTAEKQAG